MGKVTTAVVPAFIDGKVDAHAARAERSEDIGSTTPFRLRAALHLVP